MVVFIKKASKVIYGIAGGLAVLSFLYCVAMMLLICLDVFLRKFFNRPILGSYEIVQFILMCLVFSSFAYAQAKKGHIRVTMFAGKAPCWVRAFLAGTFELAGAGLAFVCSYAAIVQAGYLYQRGWVSDVLKFSTYPFYYAQAASLFIFGLVLLWDAFRNFYAMTNKEYAQEIQKEYV